MKNLTAMQETWSLIPVLGRSPGEGHDSLLQDSCPQNSMEWGSWWATVHRLTKSRTQLRETLSLLSLSLHVSLSSSNSVSHSVMSDSLRSHRLQDHQAPLSVGFSRQEYWSGLPFPSPEDLLDPGMESGCPILQADCFPFEIQGRPWVSLSKLFNITNSQLLHLQVGMITFIAP